MGSVIGLGYIVATSPDLDAWESFATDVLGAEIADKSPDRLRLRLDDRAWRFEIHKSGEDGIRAVGWEVQSQADLDSLAESLTRHDYAVEVASESEARSRDLSGLVRVKDSVGLTLELFVGQQKSTSKFVSPTGATFITGNLGLGHVSQWVRDPDAQRQLYQEVLGFRVSDYIDLGSRTATFLHCNPRHHSIAIIPQPERDPRISHIMLEVGDLDTVGMAMDRAIAAGAELGNELGKHSNDKMISFYVKTPSGWQIEYGCGGVRIDDRTWVPARWDRAHEWGGRGAISTVTAASIASERTTEIATR